MIDTGITIAISFVGVVAFGAALVLALVGLFFICVAREGDCPVELSPRGAGACALFTGTVMASNLFSLLVGTALR